MKVQSNDRIDKIQVIGNKTYLNLDIKDISYVDDSGNEIQMYQYEQFKFLNPVSNEVLAKSEKEYRLQTIKVTTENGNTFDANETARTNMMAAILSADLIGKTEESWKLADNSTETITLNELKQALALAIQAVGEIVKGERL